MRYRAYKGSLKISKCNVHDKERKEQQFKVGKFCISNSDAISFHRFKLKKKSKYTKGEELDRYDDIGMRHPDF